MADAKFWTCYNNENAPTEDELRKATERFLESKSNPPMTRRGDCMTSSAAQHLGVCEELNELYAKKNADYGDSFHASYLEWGLTMSAIRLGDKYNRFCNLIKNPQKVTDESIRDTLIDLANYAIMTVMEMDGR